jgi:hypothetical protein
MVANAPEVFSATQADTERLPLESLLQHPAIWRGRSAAQVAVVPSGFTALDESLPGGGWPRAGLIEILVPHVGVGELHVLLPALASLTQKDSARWCAWIAPPFEPYAPALVSHGVALERVFVTRTEKPLWAFEQALASGACEAVLAWVPRTPAQDIRKLQLAAEKGRSLGVLFRPQAAARESSSAMLRVLVEPCAGVRVARGERGAQVTLLKSRGGRRGSVDLKWAQGSADVSHSQEGALRFSSQRSDSHTGSL